MRPSFITPQSDDDFTGDTMPSLVKTLHDLKKAKAEVGGRHDHLAQTVTEHMERHHLDVIEVEGLPPLRLKDRNTTEKWDSHAVERFINDFPIAFKKLVELGAVQFDPKVIALAVQNGQIAGKPAGGFVGRVLHRRRAFARAVPRARQGSRWTHHARALREERESAALRVHLEPHDAACA